MFIALEFFSFYVFSIRQSIAISILLLSTKFIEEKKFFKFLIMVAIATLIHKTSALFVIVYFFRNIKISANNCLIFLGIVIVTFIVKEHVMNIIMNIVFSEYIDKSIANTGYKMLILMACILIFSIFIIKNNKTNLNTNTYIVERVAFNSLLFTIILQVLALQRDIVARLITNYYIFIIVLLPNILTYIDNKKTRNIIKISTCYVLIGLGIFFIMRYDTCMNYKFFWN